MRIVGVVGVMVASVWLFICSAVPVYETVQGDWARATLSVMTLRQKIGQLFMVAVCAHDQTTELLASCRTPLPYRMDREYITWLIREYQIGGVIFLSTSSVEQQVQATNYFQSISATPLLIGHDGEWGLGMRLYDGLSFPRNNLLGQMHDDILLYAIGREIGAQYKSIGVHINFSPVVDVATNHNNPVIGSRSFGSDPELVAGAGVCMMRGLQDAGVLACAKHFPGHGDTSVDSHVALPVAQHGMDRLERVELVPFRHLIDAGVAAVMTAHIALPQVVLDRYRPCSLAYDIVTVLLEQHMQFHGLKVTDGLGMKAVTDYYEPGQLELEAVLAGNDIILCPLDVPSAVLRIEQAIHDGKILVDDLEKRALKILKAKEWAGVLSSRFINYNRAKETVFGASACELQKRVFDKTKK
jgi:beta-N-acetylhexosaminidase